MRNARRLTGIVVVAVAAVSAALAINGASDGSALETPRTLTLSTPFDGGKTHEVDLGRKGIGAGDMALSTDTPLRDEQTGRRVGTLERMETILSGAHNGTVALSGAIRLRDGGSRWQAPCATPIARRRSRSSEGPAPTRTGAAR